MITPARNTTGRRSRVGEDSADSLFAPPWGELALLQFGLTWASANPHAARTHDHKIASQLSTLFSDQVKNGFWQGLASVGREPGKNNASRRLRVGINELAEVLVFGENDAFLPDSRVHHGLII